MQLKVQKKESKMAYVTYDKAKWHWGAKNAPTDIPQENGATHIAFFFRWCMERKLSIPRTLRRISQTI